MTRKILVAVENTVYCRKIPQYLRGLFSGDHDVIFYFHTVVPHYGSQASAEMLDQQDILATLGNTERKKFAGCKTHLLELKEEFIKKGFTEDQIETEVSISSGGVANKIIHTAIQGKFDAIVIGKKNLGLLEQVVSGSISSTILAQNDRIPVWVVNGDIHSNKVLVPVDCSPHTLDAIDHLAFILKDNPLVEITLFHSCSMLAREKIYPKDLFYEKWGKEWVDQHLQGDADGHFHFHAPEQILREADFPMERVHRLQTSKGIEPGQQIAHLVKHDGYGTVVMGRRHKDISKGIFQGVSDRVLANVSDVALWVVG